MLPSFRKGHTTKKPAFSIIYFLVLEIPFLLIKANKSIKGLTISNHKFIYKADVDDTCF